ncbi:MAG: hypothetical protein RL261_569 [Pseudomonadota bacterium]|jgi:hypothetical protein
MVLILWLVILGPLRSFWINVGGLLNSEFDQPALASSADWLTYKRWTWIVWLFSAGIAISAGYRLWRHHRKTSVGFAMLALWAAGPGALLGYLAVTALVYGRMTTASPTALILGATASCLFAAAWTVYLKRSRRIALTYS